MTEDINTSVAGGGSDSPDAMTLAPPPSATDASSASLDPELLEAEVVEAEVVDPAVVEAEVVQAEVVATVPSVVLPPADYSDQGVPSLDFVRDKIEGRYAKSLGSTELAQGTPEARSFEEQAAKREETAKERLEAIRRSMRGNSPS